MKRYKVVTFDFDSRPSLFRMETKDSWEEKVKELHKKNKEKLFQDLINQFGSYGKEKKSENFVDLGDKPVSILAYHNRFLDQIRQAFVIGAYYPALVASCTLGERILNHLIIALKEDYRTSPAYKKVYAKNSIDDWLKAISALESWKVLLPNVAKSFVALKKIRDKVVHFDTNVDTNDRLLALEAIIKLQSIIGEQFSAFGPQPWFITGVPGEIYIKKDYESNPFIKRVYLPNCYLVGPYHATRTDVQGHFIIKDDYHYEEKEIPDDEFVALRKKGKRL